MLLSFVVVDPPFTDRDGAGEIRAFTRFMSEGLTYNSILIFAHVHTRTGWMMAIARMRVLVYTRVCVRVY